MMDRRRHSRIPTNECCVLRVEDSDSRPEFDGVVADVSESGMKVLLDHPIPAATSVTVLLANHLVMASIVYCHREQGVFALGLRIVAASEELQMLCRQGLVAASELAGRSVHEAFSQPNS